MLAKQRQLTSLIDMEIIAESTDMVFQKTDWVPLYMDRGYSVVSDCGRMRAFRSITMKGQLLWLVFTPGKTRGYHATAVDPLDAMEQAQESWAKRREVRQNWDQVERTASDLIWGRQRFDITIEDLDACPLCTLGIEGFRNAIGMRRVTRMSGRAAALLMKLEPQMGFVISASMERHGLTQGPNKANSSAVLES
jgi:hypothetical protein